MALHDIAAVLSGERDYDTLTSDDQAVVRAAWARRMAVRISELDLAEVLAGAGDTWVEIDDSGRVVRHGPDPRR